MNRDEYLKKVENVISQYKEGAIMYCEVINSLINNSCIAAEHEDYIKDQEELNKMIEDS